MADAEGNLVVITFTNEEIFGTGACLPGRGFVINNELTDFNFGGLAPVYPTHQLTGTTTLGSNVVTDVSSIAGLTVGQFFYSNNTTNSATPLVLFPNDTQIVSISGSDIVLSNNALGTATSATFIATPETVGAGSFSPGGANEASAFRRPGSSITPVIVLDKCLNPVLGVGCAGSAGIIPTHILQLIQILDLGFDVVKATNSIRILNSNGTSNPAGNGDDPTTEAAVISTLNARNPTFNIIPSINNQTPVSSSTAISIQTTYQNRIRSKYLPGLTNRTRFLTICRN